jgi:peptidoglycan/xylan/chitin deacetylase (PgdA/CDA1 family)
VIGSGLGRRDVLVLCYHGVSERWPARLAVTPARLDEQVRLLLARGYSGTTFSEAITAPPARRTFAITFDDAYRSVHAEAFPVLSGLGVAGTVFVPTALVGTGAPMSWPGIDEWLGGPYESELVGMSWEEIAALADAGWEVGSHTRSHPRLTEVGDEQLATELEQSRADCEQRLGRPCGSVAYPYGDVDERVEAAARAAGYATAAGLPFRRYEPPVRLRWPREGIYIYDDVRKFRRKVSPTLRRLRGSRTWPLLVRTRRRLRGR